MALANLKKETFVYKIHLSICFLIICLNIPITKKAFNIVGSKAEHSGLSNKKT